MPIDDTDPRWRKAYEELIKKENRAKARRYAEEENPIRPDIPRWSGGCHAPMNVKPMPREEIPAFMNIELSPDRFMNSAAKKKRERRQAAMRAVATVKALMAEQERAAEEQLRETKLMRAVEEAQQIALQLRAEVEAARAEEEEEALVRAEMLRTMAPAPYTAPLSQRVPLAPLRRVRSGDLPPRFEGEWTFDNRAPSTVPHGVMSLHHGTYERTLEPLSEKRLTRPATLGGFARPAHDAAAHTRSSPHLHHHLVGSGGAAAFQKVRAEATASGRPVDPLILRYALSGRVASTTALLATGPSSHNAFALSVRQR